MLNLDGELKAAREQTQKTKEEKVSVHLEEVSVSERLKM